MSEEKVQAQAQAPFTMTMRCVSSTTTDRMRNPHVYVLRGAPTGMPGLDKNQADVELAIECHDADRFEVGKPYRLTVENWT